MTTQNSAQKVAVVTGGNKGIGYGIVKGLCEKFKGIVYLTARDVGRGEEAVAKLKKLGHKPLFHQLDVSDQNSVTKLKEDIVKAHGGIDLLVNNAAIFFLSNAPEPFGEQAETIIAVNYFSLLRVCETLSPILRKNARIVNLSSGAGHLSMIPSEELKIKLKDDKLTIPQLNKLMEQFVKDAKDGTYKEKGWGGAAGRGLSDEPQFTTYIVSKVGVCALTRIQQKNFDSEKPQRNIAVNSVHPGFVDTDLNNHEGLLTIEQGASAPLFLALDAKDDVKGKYVWSDSRLIDWDSDTTPNIS